MYSVGDKIVYPMHGAGIISAIEEKTILGEEREYYILDLPHGDMKTMIPVDKTEEIGIRDIISKKDIDKVVKVLKAPSTPMSNNWNHRNRKNMEKLKTGDIMEVAEVVRNLARVELKKHLSTGEKKMLTSARQILTSEFMLAGEIDAARAEEIINAAI